MAIGRNEGQIVRLISDQEPKLVELAAGSLSDSADSNWTRYIVGTLIELNCGTMGLDISVSSDVPMRRGLASSAALTVATALSLTKLMQLKPASLDLALTCQRVEQKYLGVSCGLLDPYTALHGKANHLLLVDCAEQSHEQLSFPSSLGLVVCDSQVDRQLSRTLYNIRRSECQQVANALSRPWLRGATFAQLDALRERLPIQTRRAEHVLNEIDRVIQFCRALHTEDYQSIHQIMAEAHRSCRVLFECSHPKVDALVDRASQHGGCLGARMTGGGWGGATISIVYKDQMENFCRDVSPKEPCIAW